MGSRKKAKEKKRQQREALNAAKALEAEQDEKKRLEHQARIEVARSEFEKAGKEYYLVMYDVRGIQDYIYRTSKLKDAIGASAMVGDIIGDALNYAVKRVKDIDDTFSVDLEWFDQNGPTVFEEDYKDVKVLFIGGGNAFVLISSKESAVQINKIMAKYILDRTYSLQLAVAMVKKTENYAEDYRNVFREMVSVKENMIVSQPLGALPIMKVELKTGYPTAYSSLLHTEDPDASTETRLKKTRSDKVRKQLEIEEKKIDSYITEKGVDSTVAVVHIDGNNMGMRIRELIQDKKEYTAAVRTMRNISYQINTKFVDVFDSMKEFFESRSGIQTEYKSKQDNYYIMKVLDAGDDVTYFCNGKIAIATVEYFCREISKYAMIEVEDENERESNLLKNGFSVCAGIAFIGSHFPFSIGYETAENCCEEAKKAAKLNKNIAKVEVDGTQYSRIGNWIDFTFCRNIQAQNIEEMRQQEYRTYSNEQLLLRPYYIATGNDKIDSTFSQLAGEEKSLMSFTDKTQFFQNEKNIPRSQAKALRNMYPNGEKQTEMLAAFLQSRAINMPGGNEVYTYIERNGKSEKCARFYDALEMMDMYIPLKRIEQKDSTEASGGGDT